MADHEQTQSAGLGKVSGRVALVTGGTAASAPPSAGSWPTGRGHRGRLLARPESAEKFLASMTAGYPGQRITVHEGNIGVAADCRRVIREVIDQHGRLDILVNNAGITIDRTVAKMSDEDWQKVIAVNLSGAFFVAQAALEHMLERGTGRIIDIRR